MSVQSSFDRVDDEAKSAHAHVNLLDATSRVFNDDEGATDASSVRGDVDALLLDVNVDADKLVDPAGTSKNTELGDEARTAASEAEDVSVEVDDEMAFGVDLRSVEYVDICAMRERESISDAVRARR